MEKLINFKNKVLRFIYKYRFLIAILLVLIGVLLKLHGSSLGRWNEACITTGLDNKTIFGTIRYIRSDEWAVTTPLIFSQKYNNFKYFSDILRGGTSTDAFSLYGLPVANILEIFRPFHLGYIILGIERGLSFFWCARFIALFLTCFELFMVLFNKNKRVSLIGSFLISLSPIIQWCFATNGTVELFVFGGLALILLHKYMCTESFRSRLIYLFFIMVCAGGYVFILYPAYQIPMFFVFLMLGIYIIVSNYKNTKIYPKDVISIIFTIILFIGLMIYFFTMSKDTINTVLNTVYPGSRVETGGGQLRKYVSYLDNIIFPYKEEGLISNTDKESVIFGLFPLGIIYVIFSMFKKKKADLFTILLLIPYIILAIFCFVGMPTWLAKITLLSYSRAQRAMLPLGFIDILFLLKYLSSGEKIKKTLIPFILAFILSLGLVIITKLLNPNYVGRLIASFLFVIALYLFFSALIFNTKYGKFFFTIGIIGTMFIAGFTVNPISSGYGMIYDSPIIQAAEKINEEDNGVWLTDAMGFPNANYLIMAGCKVINATNIYPNLELWRSLDKEDKYEEIYNRYAHVIMEIREKKDIDEKFILLSKDTISVYITPDELKDMNIKYIFTVRVMEDFENENIDFELIYNENNYHIYKVSYR